MPVQNIFGYLLKLFTFLAVLGIVVLATAVCVYSFYDIFEVVQMVVFKNAEEGELILKALKAIDLVLLGVIFYIIGVGLFELFILPIDNLPEWLQIRNIDELKSMLIKVVVVVLGVSFTGRIVTWDGTSDVLGYGVGLGAVILALSYFLSVKMKAD